MPLDDLFDELKQQIINIKSKYPQSVLDKLKDIILHLGYAVADSDNYIHQKVFHNTLRDFSSLKIL